MAVGTTPESLRSWRVTCVGLSRLHFSATAVRIARRASCAEQPATVGKLRHSPSPSTREEGGHVGACVLLAPCGELAERDVECLGSTSVLCAQCTVHHHIPVCRANSAQRRLVLLAACLRGNDAPPPGVVFGWCERGVPWHTSCVRYAWSHHQTPPKRRQDGYRALRAKGSAT